MGLTKRLLAAGILSLGILSACQTGNPVKEIPVYEKENFSPLSEKEKALLKKEIEEYKNMDLYVCGHNIILLSWNNRMPGERQGLYEVGKIYEDNSGQKFVPLDMVRMREDKNRNEIDRDDKWNFNDKGNKKIIWKRDQSHYPNYFIISTDIDKDNNPEREYWYLEKKAGAVHSSFSLEKIAWDRDNDCKFSKKEIVWEKAK